MSYPVYMEHDWAAIVRERGGTQSGAAKRARMHRYVRPAGFVVLLFALSLVAYSNSFEASFHLDDMHQICNNHYIRSLSNVQKFFTDKGTHSQFSGVDYYRPVTMSTFAVSYALGGLEVRGFHAFNLALHVINSLLVMLVVGRLLKDTGRGNTLLPYAAALLFCLHPVQTQAVTYISGRAVLLSCLFSLSALYAFMRYRGSQGRAGLLFGAAAPLLFLAGMFSKEMTAGILGAMLAYDLIIRTDGRRGKPGYWPYYATFAAAVAAYVWARSAVGMKVSDLGPAYTPLNYLMSELKVVLMYVRLLLLPYGQNADYALPLTKTPDHLVALSALFIVVSLYALVRMRKAAPAESFLGIFFFVTLLPESSVFPINDLAVEYRMYMPSAGLLPLLVILGSRVLKMHRARAAAVTAALCLCVVLTHNRNMVYEDSYTYWSDVVSKSPHSFRANLGLGAALIDKGRFKKALPVLKKTALMKDRLRQKHLVHFNIGMCYHNLDDVGNAIRHYRLSLREMPDFPRALDNLGTLYFETGMYGEAAEIFEAQTELSSGNPKAEYNLAVSLMMLDENEDAIEHMETAIGLYPENFDMRYNLGLLYERTGRLGKASVHAAYARGLAANPADADAADALLDRVTGSEPLTNPPKMVE